MNKHRHPHQPDDEWSFRAQRARAMAKLLLNRSRRHFLLRGLTYLTAGVSANAVYGALKLGLNVNPSPIENFLAKQGVLRREEITRTVEFMDRTGELGGAKLIAKAWLDESFKTELLSNANSAINSSNIKMGPEGLALRSDDYSIRFVENTETTHNLVVCRLCSCYPENILGTPPKWYRSAEYRYRAANEPRQLLNELGLNLPDEISIVVHDSTVDLRYVVMPKRPEYTKGWNNKELEQIISRDVMIGVRSL